MSVLKDFRQPPAEYRFAPFWFWNHELKLEELERQILEMKDKGCGGFIMHARFGLLTPYLGRDWMAAVEHCARVAEREGLWAWLYDEDNWPSGTVGMRMAREHPEYRMSQIWISDEADLAKGETLDREVKIEDELLYVLAIPLADGQAVWGKEKDLTGRVKDGRLKYTAAAATEKVAVFSRAWFHGCFHDGYVDTLNREAIEWFISETHQKYAERLGRLLGRSVKGIFTDEPTMWATSHIRSIPFTDELPERFEKEHKTDFARALVALFFPAGPETPRVRLQFQSTVQRLYLEAFFKPIYDWCRRHGLRAIGHVDSEGELAQQVRKQTDYFATAEYMHYAGVDTLFESTFRRPGLTNNHVAAKLASSAEHLLEKERTLAEAFGVAAGWELSLPTLKWLGDFQAVLGINYFMPHAAYYSIAGFRKWECPPDQSCHVSYWPFYKVFADHLARLSAVLHGGRHVAPAALLMPVAAMGAALDPEPCYFNWEGQAAGNPAARAIEESFEETVEQLSRHQVDFDIVTEEMLSRAELGKDGQLQIRSHKGKTLESFRALVLPAARALSRGTMDLLEKWGAAGLAIVFVDALPSRSPEAGEDELLAARARKLLEQPNVCESKSAGAAFVAEVKRRAAMDVEVGEVRDILYLMKDKEDRRFVLLANASRDLGYYGLHVRVRAAGVAHLLDTRTGELTVLKPAAQDGEWTELELDFPPAGSHLVMFADKRAVKEDAPPRLETVEETRLVLGGQWQFTAEGGNFFPLRSWQLDVAGQASPLTKWSSFTKTFRTQFHAAVTPAKAVLLADGLFDQRQFEHTRKLEVKVALNGHALTDWREGTHYDRLVREADVTTFIRQGSNEVTVAAEAMFTAGLNLDQPLLLAGEFTVAGHGTHEALSVARGSIHTGSWASQGFPYFSGIGQYEQEFELPAGLAGRRLFVEFERVAHVVQVFVNDREAGVLPWAPWSLEVTALVRPGRNRIKLRIANAMANVFLLRPDESGLVGKVTVVAKQPVGAAK